MNTELVITTFQKPNYLNVVLKSLSEQACLPNRVCIADDGSDSSTQSVIESFQALNPNMPVRHVWHENLGFRKTAILNEVIRSSRADYLIFTDDDCVMHPRFIQRHLELAAPNRFITGAAIRLEQEFSDKILRDGKLHWDNNGRPVGWKARSRSEFLKSMPFNPRLMSVLDTISPVRCSWAGGNASTFRKYILEVNGFDESMGYGAEDKEFGARLINFGIKGRHIRHTAPLYHLEHSRSYVDEYHMKKSRLILKETRVSRKIRTIDGISKS